MERCIFIDSALCMLPGYSCAPNCNLPSRDMVQLMVESEGCESLEGMHLQGLGDRERKLESWAHGRNGCRISPSHLVSCYRK